MFLVSLLVIYVLVRIAFGAVAAVVITMFAAPLGLIVQMWKRKTHWPKALRVILTAVVVPLCLVLIAAGFSVAMERKNEATINTAAIRETSHYDAEKDSSSMNGSPSGMFDKVVEKPMESTSDAVGKLLSTETESPAPAVALTPTPTPTPFPELTATPVRTVPSQDTIRGMENA